MLDLYQVCYATEAAEVWERELRALKKTTDLVQIEPDDLLETYCFTFLSQAWACSVSRYFWRRLLGLSGMVVSTAPDTNAGAM